MNHLLQKMQQHKLGATVNGLYAGVFAHADDTSKKESMNMQIQLIQSFTEHDDLNLNPHKCEVIVPKYTSMLH